MHYPDISTLVTANQHLLPHTNRGGKKYFGKLCSPLSVG